MKQKEFKSADKEGNELRLFVKMPDAKILSKAENVRLRTYAEALKDKVIVEKRLEEYLREQGVWGEEQEDLFQELSKKIMKLEYDLNKGGITKSEAKQKALDLRDARLELRELIRERLQFQANTAEGVSENKKFHFLVSECTYNYLDQKKVFESLEDYEESDEPYAYDAAANLNDLLYGQPAQLDEGLVETKFLKRFNYINENGQLINENGDLVDRDGNLVDELGRRLDSEGNPLTFNGDVALTEEQSVETAEFFDDPPKRRPRKAKTE